MSNKRERSVERSTIPVFYPQETVSAFERTIIPALLKPQLYLPFIVPAPRLVLCYGQKNDEKVTCIREYFTHEKNIRVFQSDVTYENIEHVTETIQGAADDCRKYPTKSPILFIINNFELIIQATRFKEVRLYFSNLQTNFLDLAPASVGLMCICNTPPLAIPTPDPIELSLWNQFSTRILFDLPSVADVITRFEWFFAKFEEHTQNTKELSHIKNELGTPDYEWLASMCSNCTMDDVNYFAQSVFRKAVELGTGNITRDFIEPLLYTKGAAKIRSIVKRDVERDQWPFDEAAGKAHPVFKTPNPPTTPVVKTEKDELFAKLGVDFI